MLFSGPATILYNGVPVLMAENCELAFESGNTPVKTLHLGRAGHSRGAKMVTLSWRNAVPLDGLEVDWPGLVMAQQEVEIGVQTTLNKIYGLRGDLKDAKYSSDTDKPNDLVVSFEGILVSET